MTKLIRWYFRALEALIVLCLLAMVVMVFGNVVLRYFFNSGILISEEMSRYCFIWLTFFGAIVALRDGEHLGVDTLVKHLPLLGKRACYLVSQLLVLFCLGLFFWGTWKMHSLHVSNVSPVVGISMIWIYGIGYLSSVSMGVMVLHKLWRLVGGQLDESELVEVVESEDVRSLEAQGVLK
jgi:TRAP-type C4-dicarboxylate transport system permease small subunit